jgi:hypothetical protein
LALTYLIIVFCVVGVLGGVASVQSYERHAEKGSKVRMPRHSRKGRPPARRSRQLQALEAALAEEPVGDQQASAPSLARTGDGRADGRPTSRRRHFARQRSDHRDI